MLLVHKRLTETKIITLRCKFLHVSPKQFIKFSIKPSKISSLFTHIVTKNFCKLSNQLNFIEWINHNSFEIFQLRFGQKRKWNRKFQSRPIFFSLSDYCDKQIKLHLVLKIWALVTVTFFIHNHLFFPWLLPTDKMRTISLMLCLTLGTSFFVKPAYLTHSK